MPKSKLPPEIVDHWPDIFDDIEIKAIPIQYIKNITVKFSDGNTWVIDVNENSITQDNLDEVEDSLESFFDEFDDLIESIDFSLNTEKVKKDIESRTKSFMKKRK